MLPQPWYTHLLLVRWITVIVSSTVCVRPMSSLCRTYSTPLLESYCVSGSSTTSPVTIRDRLHWLPVQQRIEYKVCVLVYKCLHQAAPTHLAELCSQVSESANRGHLRSAAWGDLVVPHSRTTRYGQRCFAASGPTL